MDVSATQIGPRLDDFRAMGVAVAFDETNALGDVRLTQFLDTLRWELRVSQGVDQATLAEHLDSAWCALTYQDTTPWLVWVPTGGTDTHHAPPQRYLLWVAADDTQDGDMDGDDLAA